MRLEVIYIMSHLLITISILAAYIYTVTTGQPDVTLQTAITVILGYWFGAMGADKLKGKSKGTGSNE